MTSARPNVNATMISSGPEISGADTSEISATSTATAAKKNP